MYSNPGFPTQRTMNSNVDNGKQPINFEYIKRQSDIIKSQNQPYQGHIPNHIEPVPNDNLIQQVRWKIDAPTTRYNPNKLDKTRSKSSGSGKDDKELEASEIFSGPNQNYDPYIDYLTKKGLLNDNYKSRINTKYINVNSSARTQNPTVTKEDAILLDDNSMYYTISTANLVVGTTQNLLNINIPNHNFEVGDRMTITGVESSKYSVKALYGYLNSGILTDPYYYTIIFQENSTSLIIKTDFETSLLFNTATTSYNIVNTPTNIKNQFQSFDPNFRVGDGIQYQTLKNYNTSDMYVSLSGFTGDYIGNIPVNFLNSIHQIYFVNPDGTNNVYINTPDGTGNVSKITGFYIELPFAFKASTTDKNPLPKNLYSNMTIDIEFRYIGGIAINALNSDIPITNDNINGYQTIVAVTQNTISIGLTKDTYYVEPTPLNNPSVGQQPVQFGGSSVFVSKIDEIIGGDNNPNNYVIELPETIHNVFMVRLVKTIFPNTSRVFQKQKNNKIYWQNLTDGDIVYNAEVDEGSYTPEELQIELEKKMYAVTRNNVNAISVNNYISPPVNPADYDADLITHLAEITANLPKPATTNKGGYTNKVLFKVSINKPTSITSFQSYQEADIRRPIIKVTDNNNNTPVTDPTNPNFQLYEPPFVVKIVQPKHGLQIGDQVLFSGFIETLGIPADILNTTQTISTVSSDDTYEIVIDNFNLSNIRTNTYGGYAAKIFVPNQFRLLFNSSDAMMGTQLGFRNVGSNMAITKYGLLITNQQAYQNEIVTTDLSTNISYVSNGIGNQIVLTNNALQFKGENYIYLVIREFSGSTNISQNKQLVEYFAKVDLTKPANETIYDIWASSPPITFYDMKDLQQLSVQIYGTDGELFNFNGVDHSFLLEITTLDLLPQETGINSTNNFV